MIGFTNRISGPAAQLSAATGHEWHENICDIDKELERNKIFSIRGLTQDRASELAAHFREITGCTRFYHAPSRTPERGHEVRIHEHYLIPPSEDKDKKKKNEDNKNCLLAHVIETLKADHS